jgi:hypothetical protein
VAFAECGPARHSQVSRNPFHAGRVFGASWEPHPFEQARRALPLLRLTRAAAEPQGRAGTVTRMPAAEIEHLALDDIRKHLESTEVPLPAETAT